MAIERFRRRTPGQWEPFFGIRGLQEEMNRLFADFFGQPSETVPTAMVPAVDMMESKDSLTVRAELPGIRKEDVDISIKEDSITIRGEKKEEKEEKDENRYYRERSYGSFSRTLQLPAKIKVEKVKASYKDGILEIVLPKAEESKAKEVQVKVE